jgi:hypothetical protein
MNLDLPKGDLVKQQEDGNFYGTQEFMNFLKLLKDTSNSPRVPYGTTAERPTRYLEIGLLYKDTTLSGKLISVDSLNPTVWKDSTGVVV